MHDLMQNFVDLGQLHHCTICLW